MQTIDWARVSELVDQIVELPPLEREAATTALAQTHPHVSETVREVLAQMADPDALQPARHPSKSLDGA